MIEGAGIEEARSLSIVDEKLARLRDQAEHCRRLALALNDDRTISALLAMAQEYDEKADELTNHQPKQQLPR